MHDYKPGKGNGQIIPQATLGNVRQHSVGISLYKRLLVGFGQKITIIKHFKKKVISFIAILTHQCG